MVSKSSIILLLQFQVQILLQSLLQIFPFQEFPLTEIVKQSQIDISSISDTSDPRETSNSSSKATKSTDLPLQSGLKSVLNSSTHEEITEYRDLTVSDKHTQSSRDSNTIFTPDNSATRESNPGIDTGITTDTPSAPTTFPEETGRYSNPPFKQLQGLSLLLIHKL